MNTQLNCDDFNIYETEFFIEYGIDSDGDIYLADANHTFLRLNGFSTDMVGKKIAEFDTPDEVAEILHYLEVSKNEDYLFNMLREIEYNDLVTVWKTRIKADGQSVKIVGECIFSFHNTQYDEDGSVLRNYKYDSFINRHLIGFGTIDCSSEHRYFTEINPLLAHLSANQDISLAALLKSHPVLKALKIKSSCRGYYRQPNSYGIEINYTVDALPVIGKGKIKNIMLTVIPASSSNCMNVNIIKQLTVREAQVAGIAARGYPNKYIAHSLNISEGTVKKLLYNCYRKLGVGSRIEMIKILYKT